MNSTHERLKLFLEKFPLEAKKSLGQNFLISDHVVDKILEAAKSFQPENLIEIGPGPGALTEHLRKWQVPLRLLELDRFLAAHWRDQGCEVIEGDALQMDWEELIGEKKIVLVSNLPYQISSSLLIDRSLDTKGLQAMVLMFQKEVAQRINAKESTEEYGLLSVIAQNFWQIKKVCEASPRDFSPAPRIASRVLSFVKCDSKIKNRRKFLKFVKASYARRRKQLKSNLMSDPEWQDKTPTYLPAWLESRQLPLSVRAEELSPADMKDLYFHFQLE
ncbi:MAG: 16S rRNA (adenine(1518)-N(6)/adenine(1519)-N(6))-dimethyltransferase RsmA [Bdellovibrionota bacterium]